VGLEREGARAARDRLRRRRRRGAASGGLAAGTGGDEDREHGGERKDAGGTHTHPPDRAGLGEDTSARIARFSGSRAPRPYARSWARASGDDARGLPHAFRRARPFPPRAPSPPPPATARARRRVSQRRPTGA